MNYISCPAVGAFAAYADVDGDGCGDPMRSAQSCVLPLGFVTDGADCNDALPDVNPGEPERSLTPFDDDCDGGVSEASAVDTATVYADGAGVVVDNGGLSGDGGGYDGKCEGGDTGCATTPAPRGLAGLRSALGLLWDCAAAAEPRPERCAAPPTDGSSGSLFWCL